MLDRDGEKLAGRVGNRNGDFAVGAYLVLRKAVWPAAAHRDLRVRLVIERDLNGAASSSPGRSLDAVAALHGLANAPQAGHKVEEVFGGLAAVLNQSAQ